MKIAALFLALILVPALAFAGQPAFAPSSTAGVYNHEKPKPQPQPTVVERTKTDRDGWIVAGLVAAGLVGVIVWCKRDGNGRQQKAEFAPAVSPSGAAVPMFKVSAEF